MKRKIHFMAGMPRSGSTLLAALLRQNPLFHASIEGPVYGMVNAVRKIMARGADSLEITDAHRRRVLTSIVAAYYADKEENTTVFDNNRNWSSEISMLADLFPMSRLICCVRNVAWVLDSIERLVQRNPLRVSNIFEGEPKHVYGRVESLAKGFVGSSDSALRQAWCSEYSDRLIMIRFDSLTANPASVLMRLYEHLDEPNFNHDFENIEYDNPEFDQFLGLPGMHRVRSKVSSPCRQTILPPDLFNLYDMEFWEKDRDSGNGAIVL